ncbi:MAG TPA: IPT/TIG domain-containing protein [Polyangia bacterium]|jgi:hypothetical protein
MTARSRAAATGSLAVAVWGCGASSEQPAALIAVSPPMAFNDSPAALVIEGGPFRPAYTFDTMSSTSTIEVAAFSARLTPVPGSAIAGSPPISIDPVTWLSPSALQATLPAGIPAGLYNLDVLDPRGQHNELGGAFQSLGPDDQAPVLSVVAPSTRAVFGAQATAPIILRADDGAGFLASFDATVTAAGTMTTQTCTVPAGSHSTTCSIVFLAPTPAGDQDMVLVDAHATDSVGMTAALHASFRLAPQPTLASLMPMVGPAAGGTRVDVRGSDFAVPDDTSDGSQLLVDGVPLDPVRDMVTVVSSTEITAVLPAHDAGFAILTVATGNATTMQMYFDFVPAPIVKMISPNHGPVSGGTQVTVVGNHFRDGGTTVLIDGMPLVGAQVTSPNRIEGMVPAGSAPGSVAVTAYDPIGGPGTVIDIDGTIDFTYDPVPADAPDGGAGPGAMEGGGTP